MKKPIFEKPESKSGDQVIYGEGMIINPEHPFKLVYLQSLLSEWKE